MRVVEDMHTDGDGIIRYAGEKKGHIGHENIWVWPIQRSNNGAPQKYFSLSPAEDGTTNNCITWNSKYIITY